MEGFIACHSTWYRAPEILAYHRLITDFIEDEKGSLSEEIKHSLTESDGETFMVELGFAFGQTSWRNINPHTKWTTMKKKIYQVIRKINGGYSKIYIRMDKIRACARLCFLGDSCCAIRVQPERLEFVEQALRSVCDGWLALCQLPHGWSAPLAEEDLARQSKSQEIFIYPVHQIFKAGTNTWNALQTCLGGPDKDINKRASVNFAEVPVCTIDFPPVSNDRYFMWFPKEYYLQVRRLAYQLCSQLGCIYDSHPRKND